MQEKKEELKLKAAARLPPVFFSFCFQAQTKFSLQPEGLAGNASAFAASTQPHGDGLLLGKAEGSEKLEQAKQTTCQLSRLW